MRTRIHLVRHAEAHNPDGLWYSRLDGFPLSDRGLKQAAVLAQHFSSHDIAAIYSSPMQRTLQTAETIGKLLGIGVTVDQGIIEGDAVLAGHPLKPRLLLTKWRHFTNPVLPSWGEPYDEISLRMLRSVNAMRKAHRGKDVIAVSHMTPIRLTRMRLSGQRRPPWLLPVPCERASVLTLDLQDDEHIVFTYHEPAAHII